MWWERGGEPVAVLAELWADIEYRHAMGDVEVRPIYLLGVERKQRVLKWQYRAPYAFEEYVCIGWLPDGSWFVEASWHRLGAELYVADTSAEARKAAEERARELMAQPRPHDGRWEEVPAVFEPGVLPARPAAVPEWPPGHGPD